MPLLGTSRRRTVPSRPACIRTMRLDSDHCSCPIHSGSGSQPPMHRRVHHAGASSFRCQAKAVSRRTSSGRVTVFRHPARFWGGRNLPVPAPARHKSWRNARQPFRCRSVPGITRSTRTASRLPCRLAARLPAAPTQAPLPDSGFSSTRATVAGTGHHPGRQSPSPVRASLHLIGHVAGPGNAACVSPARCAHIADRRPASAARHVCARRLADDFRVRI